MKPKIFSTIKFFIGWPLSIVALFFISRIIFSNFTKVLPYLHHIDYFFIFISIVCFVVFFLVRSFFWHKMLFFKGIKNNYLKTSYLWEVSEIKRYIPGNVWAIAGRTNAFAKEDVSKRSILKLWVLEMEFLVFACSILSLFSLSFIINTFFPDNFSDFFIIILLVVGLVVLTIIFLFSRYIVKFIAHLKIAVIRHLFPSFSFSQNLYLLCIMSVAYIFFGIATWFSIFAVFSISPSSVLLLSSFFVFSFFIGYASLISPMGLGIREAVMTAGLVKYIILAEAAFAAIFSRIVLIAAEIIFFLGIIICEKIYHDK